MAVDRTRRRIQEKLITIHRNIRDENITQFTQTYPSLRTTLMGFNKDLVSFLLKFAAIAPPPQPETTPSEMTDDETSKPESVFKIENECESIIESMAIPHSFCHRTDKDGKLTQKNLRSTSVMWLSTFF